MLDLRPRPLALAAAVLVGALAGCSPRSENKPAEAVVTPQTAPAPVTTASDAAATASAALGNAADNIKQAADEAKDKAAVAGDKAAVAADKAGDKIAAAAAATKDKAVELAGEAKELAGDAAVTARVKTTLAADAKLSALDINVDTKNGVVTLKGTAPDAAARSHATELVKGIKGVTKVDNQLKASS
jgi:osmotically-inducible protein OsmY